MHTWHPDVMQERCLASRREEHYVAPGEVEDNLSLTHDAREGECFTGGFSLARNCTAVLRSCQIYFWGGNRKVVHFSLLISCCYKQQHTTSCSNYHSISHSSTHGWWFELGTSATRLVHFSKSLCIALKDKHILDDSIPPPPASKDGSVLKKQEQPSGAVAGSIAVDDGLLHLRHPFGANAFHGHDPLGTRSRYTGAD